MKRIPRFCSRWAHCSQANGLVVGVVLLVLLAFGGGLSLAYFSFNSNEHTASVHSRRAPEFLYTRPVESRSQAQPPWSGGSDTQGVPNSVSDPSTTPAASENLGGISDFDSVCSNLTLTATNRTEQHEEFRESPFSAPAGIGGAHEPGLPIADAAPQLGYQALETAVVPEPGTTALMAVAALAFLARAYVKRR